MNYKKTKRLGEELIVIGITILLCTLFFIFFGTKLLINTAYLADDSVISQLSASDTVQGEDAVAVEETTTVQSDSAENGNNSDNGNTSVVLEDEDTTKKMQEEQTKKPADTKTDSISIPGIKSMTIPKNTKQIDVDLYNPAQNNCYFEISILLKDSNKQIYKSGLVRPGQHIYQIDLSETLPAGEYKAVLHYDAYTMDDNQSELNGANVEFTLIVK